MNSVQNSSDRRRSSVTMKTNHSRNNSATMSNNSSSSSLGSRNSTTTTSNNVDQQQHQHFLFHAPDPHLHAPLDPLHHRSLIDFRGGSGSLLTFDHPSTAWENFNGGWDGPMGNNNGANPPDLSTTQEFNAVYHPTAKDDTPKRPNLGESLQPQKKQCNSSGSAATNSKPTTNKIAAKSVLESKDPQSIAAKNRRERISERLKTLQELVPNGSKVDLVTMLEKAISYVKFLQLQVKVLAMDEFWPAQGARAPDISQVKEAIDAILSTQRARKSSSSNSNSR